jgi:hypothetical protein
LFGFPARFFVALVLAAVPGLLTLRQRNFALCDAVAKVYPQWNNGQTFGLCTAGQLMNFVLVQQEFTGAQGFMVPRAAGHVLSYVGVHQPRAAGFEIDVGVANIRLSFAKSFHFGAVKDQPGFIPLQQMIIVGGGAILRDDLLLAFFGLFRLFG